MEKIKLIFRFICFVIQKFVQKIIKFKKIISIILICLFVFTGFSAIFDGVRIKNEKEPIFVIKSVSNEPLKITYTGLGYKIIRYPMVSEYEPFTNNIGVKMGTWFMSFELEDIVQEHKLFDIIDLTKTEMLPCDDVIETFYEDENYVYQFPCAKGNYVLAHFVDGVETTVSEALKSGDITINDLDVWKIEYIKTKK